MPKARYKKGSDGRWRTMLSTGEYDDNGRLKTIRLSSSISSADLERKVRETKFELEHGYKYISKTMSLKEYIPMWLETKKNRSKNTYQEYEYFATNHLKSLEDMSLENIRTSDIQRHINSYSSHPSMCKKIILTLRQILDMAVDESLIQKNPCGKIALPREVKEEKRILTEHEAKLVKNAEGLDMRERALIHILYGTGMRPAEAYALRWSDIDLNEGTVNINKALQFGRTGKTTVGYPKTNKSIRTIPLPDFVIGSILAYKTSTEHSPTFYLFGQNGALYANRTGYDHQVSKILSKLGIEGITAYSFRHNFCSLCYNQKMDLKTVQHLLGHTDTKMILSIYAHIDKSNAAMSAAIKELKF